MAETPDIPLSVLDLALVADGTSSGDALNATTELAKRADELGYERFWVAEHHNMETVASTAPPVLIAHLAANTKRIKVGSGGVMLPNHAPLAVAEQFALLEALHPGRINLGIGRAPGTDQYTAAALRRSVDGREAEDFPRHLLDVMGLLGDIRTEHGLWEQLRATPAATSSPAIMLLGSSGFSAQLSGVLGIPFAFANHFDMGGTDQASDIYRESFQPSHLLDEPYLIVSATTVVGETTEHAEFLAGPSRLRRFGLRSGRLLPLLAPEEAAAHPNYAAAVSTPTQGLTGTAEEVVAGLAKLQDATGASEIMTYPVAHSLNDRITCLEEIGSAWFSSVD